MNQIPSNNIPTVCLTKRAGFPFATMCQCRDVIFQRIGFCCFYFFISGSINVALQYFNSTNTNYDQFPEKHNVCWILLSQWLRYIWSSSLLIRTSLCGLWAVFRGVDGLGSVGVLLVASLGRVVFVIKQLIGCIYLNERVVCQRIENSYYTWMEVTITVRHYRAMRGLYKLRPFPRILHSLLSLLFKPRVSTVPISKLKIKFNFNPIQHSAISSLSSLLLFHFLSILYVNIWRFLLSCNRIFPLMTSANVDLHSSFVALVWW